MASRRLLLTSAPPSLLLLLLVLGASGLHHHSLRHYQSPRHQAGSLVNNCTLLWFTQYTDHFNWGPADSSPHPTTFQQRVFINDDHFGGNGSPIFFYAGNEANVELYVDHTGLMWENAADFKALIVFAEHRFFGQSQVTPGADGPSTSEYPLFSVEQAMADYNHFLFEFKQNRSIEDSPVIVFGGSYGGMLAAWLRIKYPETFLGAVAASAPISGFAGQQPEWDSNTYWQVVTRDATPAAGAPAACADNVRNSFVTLFKTGASESGRAHLSDLFRLCKPLGSTSDVQALAMWIAYAWDTMAMGDFPYPSNYLTSNGPMLPAYPVTAACQHLATANLTGDALLQGVLAAASVFTNATANLQCNDVPFDDVEQDGIWDWLFCTETMHQETYFSLDGQRDMFWSQPWNTTFINDHCFKKYGVTPRYTKAALAAAGNVVLSNGLLDPWSSAGIKRNISNTVTAIILEHGAHHLDLMFSTPQDPVDVSFARWFEMQRVREWLAADAATRSL